MSTRGGVFASPVLSSAISPSTLYHCSAPASWLSSGMRENVYLAVSRSLSAYCLCHELACYCNGQIRAKIFKNTIEEGTYVAVKYTLEEEVLG